MSDDRTELLRAIKDEVLNLTAVPLAQERRTNGVFPVIGEGSHTARIMFIGEAPGRNEAQTGRPFVGAAGKILDTLLAAADIPRADVYITNIVKDRPPNNRDPFPDEIAAYGPFLDRQIAIIQPAVIATLGRFAMSYILQKFGLGEQVTTISNMHGKTFSAQAPYGAVTIIPLYHPAVAVYDRSQLPVLEKDFRALKQFSS